MKSDMKAAMDKARTKRLETVRRLHKQGKTPKEIGNVLEVSRQRAHQLLAEAGCK